MAAAVAAAQHRDVGSSLAAARRWRQRGSETARRSLAAVRRRRQRQRRWRQRDCATSAAAWRRCGGGGSLKTQGIVYVAVDVLPGMVAQNSVRDGVDDRAHLVPWVSLWSLAAVRWRWQPEDSGHSLRCRRCSSRYGRSELCSRQRGRSCPPRSLGQPLASQTMTRTIGQKKRGGGMGISSTTHDKQKNATWARHFLCSFLYDRKKTWMTNEMAVRTGR